jgi:hypothetical protein
MSKKELLDPIGSLCRLISLAFSPKGTKISIKNHVVILDEPVTYQFLTRMMNGDSRDNVSEIYDVIVRLIKWFVVYDVPQQFAALEFEDDDVFTNSDSSGDTNSSFNSKNIQNSLEIRKMIGYLIISFEKMQHETYNNGNVILAIQFYINILKMSLDGTFRNEMLPNNIDCETLLDYNKLKNLWNLEDVKYICDKYEECFEVLANESYGVDNNKGKDKIIYGIISYIDEKLNKKNAEFQKLIKNSTS